MFKSGQEYETYKAVELEGAVNDIFAERRRVNEGDMADSKYFDNWSTPDKPLTIWIDKVKEVVFVSCNQYRVHVKQFPSNTEARN